MEELRTELKKKGKLIDISIIRAITRDNLSYLEDVCEFFLSSIMVFFDIIGFVSLKVFSNNKAHVQDGGMIMFCDFFSYFLSLFIEN